MKHKEECGCCNGTGKIKETEFVDGDEYSCMTCNGKGSFEWDDTKDTVQNHLDVCQVGHAVVEAATGESVPITPPDTKKI